ncbi:MAG: DUF1553 domain-containing protein, partial [Verrucomicrobia bacterium]|nr:DUF1553 domain-containing protein [Verrucomicrobiota bacterium]
MKRTALLTLTALLLTPLAASHAAEFYVAPNGNDANSGSRAAPWKTLSKAANTMASGDTAIIRVGTYRETVTPRAGQIFAAAAGELVEVTGCDVVGPWRQVEPGRPVYMAEVTAEVRAVFFRGQAMDLARHPNHRGDHLATDSWAKVVVSDAKPDRTARVEFSGEQWPTNQWVGLTAFFSQVGYKATAEWKEEIVYFDPGRATNGLWRAARFPDGQPSSLTPERDPRAVFADWLIQPQNPWFTRNIANRVWSWLLGRGIIHEPDDARADNPPSHPELLAYLEKELIGAKYELKHLFRLILNSRTYQLASIPASDRPEAETHFAHYPLRRLEAEVLIDALNQITGSTEKYTSAIPEPFTFIPENQRSIALPDGSITSSFLELFGRPPRDTGMESERANRPTAAQRLHLLNSIHIQRKIEQSRMIQYQTQDGKTPREMATGLYLGILSRLPTEAELKVVESYAAS